MLQTKAAARGIRWMSAAIRTAIEEWEPAKRIPPPPNEAQNVYTSPSAREITVSYDE